VDYLNILKTPDFAGIVQGVGVRPIHLKSALRRVTMGMGADMKNAIAIGYGSHVVLSPHAGALDALEAVEAFEQLARTLPAFLGHEPAVVAVDAHPDMQSSRFGYKLAGEWKVPVVEVQHHQAHAVACLAENGRHEGLVLVMDGTGWGGDGTIWGAELLKISGSTFRRCATFIPVPLPGGDAAVRRPARQAVGRCVQAGISLTDRFLARLGVGREEATVWEQQCVKGLNAPLTHAAGRLFDAFATVLGLAPVQTTYEGEPAICLEAAARGWNGGELPEIPFKTLERDGMLWIDWAPAFDRLTELSLEKEDRGRWAMAAHHAIAEAAMLMITFSLSQTAERCVGLSGGVFMNRILNDLLVPQLERLGIEVVRHRETPPGDGGIALGQAVVAGA